MASKPSPHILVLGAGVTGLTSALFLAEVGYGVTVVAAHMPGDESWEYTSPWAGAHWRTHAQADDLRMRDWDVQTYDYWCERLDQEKTDRSLPRAGIKIYDSHHLWSSPVREDLWWTPYVKDFRQLSPEQEPVLSINAALPAAKKIRHAAANRSVAVNVPQYLRYLQNRARALGVVFVKARIPVSEGFAGALAAAERITGKGQAAGFVNATGISARWVCGDEGVYPIKGQTVLVKGEAEALWTWLGEQAGRSAYCIPRPGSGMTILGGTKAAGIWEAEVEEDVTERILRECRGLVPELMTGVDGGFEVVSVQCGLRPARVGGARVEGEWVAGRWVVHAYGHAGGGYQNSVGSAREVVGLIGEGINGDRVTPRL